MNLYQTISSALLLTLTVGAAKATKPNIIVILSDDMGFSDLGCYGGEIATPTLDSLAENGVRMSEFYNSARSCPSRASLLTGLYPQQAGMGEMTDRYADKRGYSGSINDECVTMAEVLKGAGYSTFAAGKWHVCDKLDYTPNGYQDKRDWPLQRGFDRYYGLLTGAASYWEPKNIARDNQIIDYSNDPEYIPKEEYYLTDAITDNAIRYINESDADKPFFLYLAYTAAHWPLHARTEDIAKYSGKYSSGYEAVREARYERMIEMGIIDKSVELSPCMGDWDKVKDRDLEEKKMEVYAAMVDRMDQGINRVMQTLRARGDAENTIVLFMQDNGGCNETAQGFKEARNDLSKPFDGGADRVVAYGAAWANVSNTPFRMYKRSANEGGTATPLIASWGEGITNRGAIIREPAHLIDIMATCVDVSGAKYPTTYNGNSIVSMQGRSLLPIFDGEQVEDRPIFFAHMGNNGVLVGDWKMVNSRAGKWQLYNRTTDRSELEDLADTMPEKVKELDALWRAWAERCYVRATGAKGKYL